MRLFVCAVCAFTMAMSLDRIERNIDRLIVALEKRPADVETSK